MHLDPSNRLYRENDNTIECPACKKTGQMTMVSTPDFHVLQRIKPESTGVVLQCNACKTPAFYSYDIRKISESRVDFVPVAKAVDKRDDGVSFAYLPDTVAEFYRGALGCHHQDLNQAFAAMCRLTTQATINDLNKADKTRNAKLAIYQQVDEIGELAQLDEQHFTLLRNILFDTAAESLFISPENSNAMTAILLETMKDILNQAYVRRARLRKALRMRQFFANAEDDSSATIRARVAKFPDAN